MTLREARMEAPSSNRVQWPTVKVGGGNDGAAMPVGPAVLGVSREWQTLVEHVLARRWEIERGAAGAPDQREATVNEFRAAIGACWRILRSAPARRFAKCGGMGLCGLWNIRDGISLGILRDADQNHELRTPFWRLVNTHCVRYGRKDSFLPHSQAGTGSRSPMMTREEVALVVLSLAEGRDFTPVQIQKSLFLTSDRVPEVFSLGSKYNFQPYDYGPFDHGVYLDIERLRERGLAVIKQQEGRWRTYAATKEGIEIANELLKQLQQEQIDMIRRIVSLVRKLSFEQLVSAIYKAYPHMKEKSVFVE
jgi:uncharacterized protein